MITVSPRLDNFKDDDRSLTLKAQSPGLGFRV